MRWLLQKRGLVACLSFAVAAAGAAQVADMTLPRAGSWIEVSPPASLSARTGLPLGDTPWVPDLERSRRDWLTAVIGASGTGPQPLGQVTVKVTVRDPNPVTRKVIRVAGSDRYGTMADASNKAFGPVTGTVVIATGANWPDALGGSALAGAVGGPLLLTPPGALCAQAREEIVRLRATKVYVLGGELAVGRAVEGQLVEMLGRGGVVRLGGSDRFATARLVANETIRVLGGAYSGDALVTTGSNFPDATAGAALAASLKRPILLASARGEVYLPASVRRVLILGGRIAVPLTVEQSLRSRLGQGNVSRAGGEDRYETAVRIAEAGVAAGMTWNGMGLATGINFPDALAGGAMLGSRGSVLLLTRPDVLSPEARTVLHGSQTAAINTIHIFGGYEAVSLAVERAVVPPAAMF